MKTLIVIGYVWPEPASSAAGSRMLQILAPFISADYRVIFASPADESAHAPDLSQHGIESQAILLNSSTFDDWIREIQPDVVMFDRFMMEEQFGWRVEAACPDALRVLDMEDAHSLRHARHQAVKQGREVTSADWQSDMAFREIAAILRCDVSLVISEYEMDWLTSQFPVRPEKLLYLPFMYTPEQGGHIGTEQAFQQRSHFVSIGNFRHEPNWDAVLQLSQLWPRIRKRLPDAELHIYGAYPPPKATQLHNPKTGFLVKGWADDAATVIRSARVMLAPLRFGAGLKGKLAEAACCGTPAVTTPTGAEGMYGNAVPVRVAASDDSFIEAAVALYSDSEQWQFLSSAGPEAVIERFNEAQHQRRLIDGIHGLIDGLERHRSEDFIGGMLRHHSMKSTRYMSQWIEAKNRLRDISAKNEDN